MQPLAFPPTLTAVRKLPLYRWLLAGGLVIALFSTALIGKVNHKPAPVAEPIKIEHVVAPAPVVVPVPQPKPVAKHPVKRKAPAASAKQ